MKKQALLLSLVSSATLALAGGMGTPVVEPEDVTPEKELVIEGMEHDGPGRFEKSTHDNKFYAGGSFGMMKANGEIDSKGASISLIAGYSFNDFAGIEARYSTLIADADYGDSTKNINMSNFAVYLKQQMPISTKFTPYGLLGYGSTSFDGDSESGLQWGLGFNYAVNEKVNMFIDYISHYNGDFDGELTEDIEMSSFGLGTTYTF